ncbi:MAG TPA: glycosyltransferase family 39 protein [Pyrinomonadaceae bacterium]|nr:glycosyltransferase family 39 protein [Pyrinomonadaceae bacterium]
MTKRVLFLCLILTLAFAIRGLTANFIRAHLNDPSWFQFGSYAIFDQQAQEILDRKQPLFWIADPSRTDRIVYPPGYPLWLGIIYKVTGARSPVATQYVQLVLDSLAVLLVVGIGVAAFGWTVGWIAGVFAALSPLLAFAGATPNADAPTSWLVLGGVWCLVIALKRRRIVYAILAGALLGLACWFRLNPLFLFLPWALVLGFLMKEAWRKRILFAASLALATFLAISPVIVRNVVTFYPQIAPTGLGFGWNLLAGIGETERGAEFGAPCCDAEIIEQDRHAMNVPADAEVGLYFPDGIRRDRDRGKRALKIIAAHPLWFAGIAARRIGGHLKYFGDPAPRLGTAGINVTGAKSLSPAHQGGVLAFAVNVLGNIQSVFRTVALPLMLVGIVIGWRRDWRMTLLLMITVLYYLFTLGIGHSEIRYGLPMQALLLIFAAITVDAFARWVGRRRNPAVARL